MKKELFYNEERLENFKEEGLGLERDNKVRLVPHNKRWKRIFSDEAYLILHKLNLESLRLYHCGSTAIPGIVAKPILDIVGTVSCLKELDTLQKRLESIGYEYKGEYGITGRRYSVLYNSKKTIGFCHLHIFKEDSSAFHEHLGFRDYLRHDGKAALKYENCKKGLDIPRDKYSELKGGVIKELLNELQPYYFPRKRAKVLVVLGAAEGNKNTLSYTKELFVNNDIEVVDLNDVGILPYLYGKNSDDGFISVVSKMIDADRVILATPVYWYAMSGIMKDFMDRFSNLLSGEHKELGERLYGKKVDLLSTGSDTELPNGFSTPFNLTATYFGMDFMSIYYKSAK